LVFFSRFLCCVVVVKVFWRFGRTCCHHFPGKSDRNGWEIVSNNYLTAWSRVIFYDNRRSPSWEISHLLWNQKVYYCVHKSTLLIPFLICMNTVPSIPPYFSWDSFYYYPLIYAKVYQLVFSCFRPNFYMHFLVLPRRNMPRRFQPWFDYLIIFIEDGFMCH